MITLGYTSANVDGYKILIIYNGERRSYTEDPWEHSDAYTLACWAFQTLCIKVA